MISIGMTVTEAAEVWDVSAETVRRWAREGQVEARLIGRTWLILTSECPDVPLGRPKSLDSEPK